VISYGNYFWLFLPASGYSRDASPQGSFRDQKGSLSLLSAVTKPHLVFADFRLAGIAVLGLTCPHLPVFLETDSLGCI